MLVEVLASQTNLQHLVLVHLYLHRILRKRLTKLVASDITPELAPDKSGVVLKRCVRRSLRHVAPTRPCSDTLLCKRRQPLQYRASDAGEMPPEKT